MHRWLMSVLTAFLALHAYAADPLHVRIDALIDAKAKTVSAPAADGEFLRRAYLDFVGTIPSADRARQFLDDKTPDKRTKLIDALLGDPRYARHRANQVHIALMERLGEHAEWMKYLEHSFATNKPWDQLVREVLRADAKDPQARGASFFLAKRLENYGQNPVDYSGLTRDVGRLFLGKNLQCAECHDHLFIAEYKQAHFQGLHSYFKNTVLVDTVTAEVGEKLTSEKTKFVSVFTKVEMATAPALPGGRMLEIPTFAKGQEYAAPPARGQKGPGVPKFSTLKAISEELPTAKNRDFARNAVNRFWFFLLGRGIVHPLDLHHAANPPSHPELLDLLADEFVAHQFDVKFLLREIALTRAYQRGSLLPAGTNAADLKHFATALEKRLSAEQLHAAVTTATGEKHTDAMKAKFLKVYANQPRDPEGEVAPSLKAALFVLHDEAILGLLEARSRNLVTRLTSSSDAAFADELYLSILTRRPTADEKATVEKFLQKHADEREAAARKLAWALLASMEFGVNH